MSPIKLRSNDIGGGRLKISLESASPNECPGEKLFYLFKFSDKLLEIYYAPPAKPPPLSKETP